MTVKLPRQKEAPEVKVGQQRRDYSALRCSLLPLARFRGLNPSPLDALYD